MYNSMFEVFYKKILLNCHWRIVGKQEIWKSCDKVDIQWSHDTAIFKV